MSANESAPKGAPETTAKRSAHSLPPGWPWAEDVDPLRLSGSERRAYYAGWQSGYTDGLERGWREGWRERVEREQRAWQHMRESIRGAFADVPFSKLAQLRGDREAAEVARLRERLLGLGEAS
jgi:hypothetical protein